MRAARFYTDKTAAERGMGKSPRIDTEAKGPNMDSLPHVSEEAAAMAQVTGTEGPNVEEHGTPVAEVCHVSLVPNPDLTNKKRRWPKATR